METCSQLCFEDNQDRFLAVCCFCFEDKSRKFIAIFFLKTDRPTDQPTNQPTDLGIEAPSWSLKTSSGGLFTLADNLLTARLWPHWFIGSSVLLALFVAAHTDQEKDANLQTMFV